MIVSQSPMEQSAFSPQKTTLHPWKHLFCHSKLLRALNAGVAVYIIICSLLRLNLLKGCCLREWKAEKGGNDRSKQFREEVGC